MAEEKWQIHAHRGGRAEFDENTLSAFKGSYDQGLRGFETDVRMCRDGALVIMHDDSIERTTQGSNRLDFPWLRPERLDNERVERIPPNEVFLGGEVAEEGTLGNLGYLRDLADRRRLVALLLEQP